MHELHAAALANEAEPCCDFIYLPEVDFDMDKFVADVSKRYEQKKNCIVAVSEGVHYADGSFVSPWMSGRAYFANSSVTLLPSALIHSRGNFFSKFATSERLKSLALQV